ncbi:hypothetical protein Taro_023518, partial [Colocasia esculenta]|nr:hypothetical protein [Colocasia esculenta]
VLCAYFSRASLSRLSGERSSGFSRWVSSLLAFLRRSRRLRWFVAGWGVLVADSLADSSPPTGGPVFFSWEFRWGGCAHVFCSECIAGYVESRVEENLVPIGCPDPGCRVGTLESDACWGVVREAVFDRWGALLCESAVAAPVRFYCPYRDCSTLLFNEGDEEGRPMTESECLHCGRTCCAQCREVPWHLGKSYEESEREGGGGGAEEADGVGQDQPVAEVPQLRRHGGAHRQLRLHLLQVPTLLLLQMCVGHER